MNYLYDKDIKTISFDLWGTLIKSNPEFSKKRLELLSKHTKDPKEVISNVLKEVKQDFDKLVEKYGIHFDRKIIYDAIFDELNITGYSKRISLIETLDNLFIKYPPLLYSEDTIKSLKTLIKEKYKLYLISNTLLINGLIVRDALDKLNISQYFNFMIFSSDFKVSKPHPTIFNSALELFNELNSTKSKPSKLKPENVLHVGDNMRTDIFGATRSGFNAMMINNDDTTTLFRGIRIKDILTFINDRN